MIKKNEVPCNLCGSEERHFLFEAKDRMHGYEGIFTYVRCKKCGLVYMNPQISPGGVRQLYPPDYGPHQTKEANRLPDGHAQKRSTPKKAFVASVCKKLPRHAQILDIGCGNGSFLNEVKVFVGCRVQGVDISAPAAKTARDNYGLDVFTGTIFESPFPDNYFDVITAWAYLEHVNNPSEVLLKISNLLKSGGSCIISTPNFSSFNSKLFRGKWYHLDCPRHLYIYSPGTIISLLEKTGLSVQKIKYDWGSKGILGSLQYCFYGDNYKAKHRNRIRKSSLLKKVVSPVAKVMTLMKKSDVMIIHTKKI